MNSMVLNPEFLTDDDITKYLTSFTEFQSWLLEENYTFNDKSFLAAKDVLSFIKSGVKIKKKKNIKLYFEQFDGENIKRFISPLSDVIDASTNEDINIALSKKNELISLGILNFTKQYIEQISQYNQQFLETESSTQETQLELKDEEQVIQQKNQQQIIEQKSQYTKWLEGDIVPILEKLKENYENHNISEELVRIFVKEFRIFVGGKLLFRITDVNERTVSGIPLEITGSGYEDMKHPFLNITWEVSAPIVKNIKYKAGDIVEASFNETRNEKFRYLLLFVDFGRATILPRSILDVLATNLKPTLLKDMLINLNVSEANDEQIQAYVIQKVLEKSYIVQQKLDKSIEELEEKFTHLQNKEKELEQKEQELNEQEKQWKTILERIDYYKRLEQFNYIDDEKVYNEIPFNSELFVEQLQSLFYFNDEQLVYNKEIIRSFVYALQSNILTVLAGPSGTGKSSIVHAFANAVTNVEVRMVPVQSSWTDTQDLLGYFHPTDKAFVPTPFMEAMAEAAHKDNAHKIFLICLDEMNLAHVEYYFSEILSVREEKKQEIRLYPKRHWETAKLILEQGQVDIERLQSARELIEKYTPIFSIPPNVRFIGTLNMDHTVKPLSPKVIDRSFIIEINHLSVFEKREIISSLEVMQGKVNLNYEEFSETYSEESVLGAYIDELQDVSNLFEEFPNASLNSRGIKHLTKILTFCKNSTEIEKFIDYLIYGKILPRLEIKKSDFVPHENSIMSQLQKYEKSYIKLQKMIEAKHTITFW